MRAATIARNNIVDVAADQLAIDRFGLQKSDLPDRVGTMPDRRNRHAIQVPIAQIRICAVTLGEWHQHFFRAFVFHVQVFQVDVEAVGLKAQLRREGGLVRCPKVFAGADVFLRAVAVEVTGVDAEAELITQRTAKRDVHPFGRLVRDFCKYISVPRIGWSFAVKVDSPGNGVASIQGALRTPGHLHPFDVEEVRCQAIGIDRIDAINIHGNC